MKRSAGTNGRLVADLSLPAAGSTAFCEACWRLGTGQRDHATMYGKPLYLYVKRTTVWLADLDREAIDKIRRRFGVASDSDAIRLALRTLADARVSLVTATLGGHEEVINDK